MKSLMANMNMTIRAIVSFIKATTQKIHVSVEKPATAYIKQVSSLTARCVPMHSRRIHQRSSFHKAFKGDDLILCFGKQTETNVRTNRLDKNK